MDGILNICKPRGISSFKALSMVKGRLAKELGVRPKSLKVGHLGTLDPAACGVLILLIGKYTKKANELHASTKTYRTAMTFGVMTDSIDLEGKITATSDRIPTREQILAVLPEMIGEVEIEIPKFSAVHINGERAYDLARKGVEFTAPKKVVTILQFNMLSLEEAKTDLESIGEEPELAGAQYYFEIECETGTYIRSLAKLLAEKLGTLAIASLIIRTKVGDFSIQDSKQLKTITISDTRRE